MGGLLTLPSFLRTFPELDVNAAPASRRSHVSTIQGAHDHSVSGRLQLTSFEAFLWLRIMLVCILDSSCP